MQKSSQCIHIHKQLICIFVPHPKSGSTQNTSCPFFFRICICPRQHRSRRAAPRWCLRIKMTCICFHQDLIGVAFFSADCQTVIFNKLMWFIHPCRTIISECLSVDKYGGFSSGIQVHHDSLSFCCFRKDHSAFKPTVFPGFPPYKTWFCRRKVPL